MCVLNWSTFFSFLSFYKSHRSEQNLQKPITVQQDVWTATVTKVNLFRRLFGMSVTWGDCDSNRRKSSANKWICLLNQEKIWSTSGADPNVERFTKKRIPSHRLLGCSSMWVVGKERTACVFRVKEWLPAWRPKHIPPKRQWISTRLYSLISRASLIHLWAQTHKQIWVPYLHVLACR